MKRRVAVFLLAAVGSCGLFTDPKREPAVPPQQLTGLPRDLTPDEVRASSAANQFALTLFKRLNAAQPDSNVFVSPLSVSFALGMAMNGARGATFNEMRATLGFGVDELAKINAGYRGLLTLESGLDASTTFRIANSAWSRNTFPLLPSFVTAMKQTFDADVVSSPFDAGTVLAVNNWVSANTAGKIPTILDDISSSNVMLLLNAIYFKGSWRDQFDPANTATLPFNARGGVQQVATMLRKEGEGKVRYGATAEAKVGELSYGNGAFVMSLIVPHGDIDTYTATLDTASLRALLASTQEVVYEVRLPKFKLEYERLLNEDLQAMGMATPFGGGADFTGMSPMGDQLFISVVKHKSFVDVNEEGTEAAAVTAVIFDLSSGPPCLCVDRPFIFAIRERFSGTILFMGKVVRIP